MLACSGSSVSRIPACAFTISPSAQKRDPIPVGQASSLPPGEARFPFLGVCEELGDDPTLPDPRLSHHGDELHRPSLTRPVEQLPEPRHFDRTTDVGRVVGSGEIDADPRERRAGMEHAHRLRLALQRGGRQLLVVEDGRGRFVRGEADRDAHLRGDRLDPRRGVDGISGEHPLPRTRRDPQADEGLPAVDAHPQAQRRAADRFELLRSLDDPQARADGTLRIVLVRGRHAEHPDDRVSDELLHHATVALDLGPRHPGVGREHLVHVFGVRRLRGGREPDQIAEERRDDFALLGDGTDRRAERRGALRAKPEAAFVLEAT